MDEIEDTIELKNKLLQTQSSTHGFKMAHFVDKLVMSLGWGPNPLKVVSVSWADYKDRLEEDQHNVGIAVGLAPNLEGEKMPAWEVIIHYAINTHNHCYSLLRCQTRGEAMTAAATYRAKLPPLVTAVGREILNHSTLQKVTDVLRQNPSYEAIHLAAYFGFLDAIRSEHMRKHINSGEKESGRTALHIAVQEESERVVAALLSAGADPAVTDAINDDTPLHLAANKQEALILALNVEAHSSLNMRNREGRTPLMIAAEHCRLDNIKLLLRLGANPNHEPRLHDLFHTPEYKQGLKTIDATKDISNKDLSKGGNLLHWVKTRELMNLCLDLGIDPDVQNNAGETPVHVMVCRQRIQCLVTLLSRGADPNVPDDDGNTAIHHAAALLSPTMVQALLVFGSHLDMLNGKGETARHLAASRRSEDPAEQTCRDQVVYLLHTVGAQRCTAGHLADCADGCISNGEFNGVPIYHKPLVRSRWVMDQLLEITQINQAIQWQCLHQPHLRGTGRVLCLDGGGIKGLVLTQQLFVLEQALGRPVRECFDWICGTSTGGFLALMLATGKSVKDVQTLYYGLKEKVFVGNRPYDSGPLEEVLRKEFGEDEVMSSIKGLKVMVTSTLADRLPPDLHLFRNYESPMSVIGLPESSHFTAPLPPHKQKIWLAARSSGAAPTYFSSLEQYVDGGMIANNPTLDVLTEIEEWNIAVRSKGRHSDVFVPTVVVSLGCGKAPLAKVENIDVVVPSLLDMRRGLQAVYNLFNLLVDSACPSQGRVVDRARAWCAALNVPFVRLNPQLSCDISLDESSDKKLLRIMWEARAEMRRNAKIVDHLKYLLIPPGEEYIPGSTVSDSAGEETLRGAGRRAMNGESSVGGRAGSAYEQDRPFGPSSTTQEEGKKAGRILSGWTSSELGRPGKIDIGFGDINKEKRKRGSSLKDIISSVPESPIKGLLNRGAHHLSLKRNKHNSTSGDGPNLLLPCGSSRDVSASPVGGASATTLSSDQSYSREVSPFPREDGLSRIDGSPVSDQNLTDFGGPQSPPALDPTQRTPSGEISSQKFNSRSPSREGSTDTRYRSPSIERPSTDLSSRSPSGDGIPDSRVSFSRPDGVMIPPLSDPYLSELLARSGVDPSILYHGLSESPSAVKRAPFSSPSPLSAARNFEPPAKASPTSNPLPYPLSDPPGYPYLVNDCDPDSESILPVNPLNPIFTVDSAENCRSSDDKSSTLGFCPDSPASVRSVRSITEEELTAGDVDLNHSEDIVTARREKRLSDSGLCADNYFDALDTTAMPQQVRVSIVDLNESCTKEKPVIVDLSEVCAKEKPVIIDLNSEAALSPRTKASKLSSQGLEAPRIIRTPDSPLEVSTLKNPDLFTGQNSTGNSSDPFTGHNSVSGEDVDQNLPSYSWAVRNA